MFKDKVVVQFSQQFKEVSPMQKMSEMLAELGAKIITIEYLSPISSKEVGE